MKKFIVTTTVQPPTEATLKFSTMKDWKMIVVGDMKTPHSDYENGPWIYLHPDQQKEDYPELSDAIGWHCVMRRNLGFIEAYKQGADIIATIDDDNIPYDGWGANCHVGQEFNARVYTTSPGCAAFDPLSVTNHSMLWHRGFPLQEVRDSKFVAPAGYKKVKVLFQADLWNGDPDVDAVCRMLYDPTDLIITSPYGYTSEKYIPFNSQNTFIAREAIPYYMVLPHIGRADDIWGGYIAQYLLNTRPVFFPPSTYQKRNPQSLDRNFKDEIFSYENTKTFLHNLGLFQINLPEKARVAFNLYRETYENLVR